MLWLSLQEAGAVAWQQDLNEVNSFSNLEILEKQPPQLFNLPDHTQCLIINNTVMKQQWLP